MRWRASATHADGAALFSILPSVGAGRLLRLLVAYEIMADFLDNVSEREAETAGVDGLRINLALVEAIDPGESISDHYRDHRWRDDGDYLLALVQACRESCVRFPSYEHVRPLAIRAARLAQVLGLNHEPEPELRDAALMAWAERECAGERELTWFESTAAASGWLTVLALLALAAESTCEAGRVADTYAAYFPWTSLVGTMLDSYVDQGRRRQGRRRTATSRTIRASASPRSARGGPSSDRRAPWAACARGHRHAVIVRLHGRDVLLQGQCAPARDALDDPQPRACGGSLAVLMLPVLRLWRILYALRSA